MTPLGRQLYNRGLFAGSPAPRLNHGAAAHARELIMTGKYDDTSPLSFDAADGDKLLGPDGNDWAAFRQFHLGESDGSSSEKGTYSYPYGKDGKVFGQALRAIGTRASAAGATEIFDEAGRLLDLLNSRTGSKNIADGTYFSMRAKADGSEGEILLYSDIGGGGGIFSDPGATAEDFAKSLKAMGKVKTLNCRINSPGGEVFEGQAIYNLLGAYPAKKIVHIDGLAASIASVIAMAGDEIRIADNAMMMIHNAWGGCQGEAKDMERTAQALRNVTSTIARTYAKRPGVDLAKIVSMMDAETWMTADEAKAAGLVDTIVDNMGLQACAFDPSRFRNTPKRLVDQVAGMSARDRFADKFRRLSTVA